MYCNSSDDNEEVTYVEENSKACISVDKNDFGYPNYVSSLYQTVKNL